MDPLEADIENRRAAIRRMPKGKPRITCRKGSLGLGRNLAEDLVDISQTGVRLIVNAALVKGDEVELIVNSAGLPRPLQFLGDVVWAAASGDNRYSIGVKFRKHLSYDEFSRLT